MNYYDEEIEINRESTKESSQPTAGKSSAVKTRLLSAKLSTNHGQLKNNLPPTENTNNNNTESSESDSEDGSNHRNIMIKDQRHMNSDKWKNLPVSQEIKDIFQNILKYVPQTIDTDYHLQPFMPDYVPSVGDVDAFLKVSCPESINAIKQKEIDEFTKKMGLLILDEPSGHQSEPSLLSMKLRSMLTNPGAKVVTQIPIAKNTKDIDKWIIEMDEIHRGQSFNQNNSSLEMQNDINIDHLMEEWPKSVEIALNQIGFPSSDLDCTLENYVKLLANIFDIPITEEKDSKFILAIHNLFNLYLAINETSDLN